VARVMSSCYHAFVSNGNSAERTAAQHEAKRELRKKIANRITLLSERERHDAAAFVASRVRSLDVWGEGCDLLVYLSMPDELSTVPVIAAAREDGLRVWAPRVTRADLRFYAIHRAGGSSLTRHPFGMDEPVADGEGWKPPGAGDTGNKRTAIVLCPCRAVDPDGNRLGRGAGFYDRFLAESGTSVVSIALAWECQVVPRVPTTAGDVAVAMIVTDRRIIVP